jgi:clan AA aspartic protease (TIGR02281 family)
MEKKGDLFLIPCKVNGLPMKFIFDTGASDVCISLTEASFMLKNGYLTEDEIGSSVYYGIANGDITEGTRIILKKIDVGNKSLLNVEATIIHSTESPLLFGQSALKKFGKFSFDYDKGSLTITNNTTKSSTLKGVKIGNQTWSSENLDVSTFRNGDVIPEVKSSEEWELLFMNHQPAWCYYNNDEGLMLGKLYNWYAVIDPRGLAPKGWKIPSVKDWEILIKYLDPKMTYRKESFYGDIKEFISYKSDEKLKSKSGWENTIIGGDDQYCGGKCNGNNIIGFNSLPSSHRNNYGYFMKFDGSHYWTSTQSDFGAYAGDTGPGGGYCVEIGNIGYKSDENGHSIPFDSEGDYTNWTWVSLGVNGPLNGLSIRCIKIPPKK